MRIIKFRGKRFGNEEWVYGYYGLTIKGKSYIESIESNISMSHNIVFSETVGQFTGKTDKKEREIFEGDILKISWLTPSTGGYFQSDDAWCENEVIAKVDFIGDRFVYIKKDGKQTSIKNGSTIEIIGNIHETPELLK